MVLIEKHASGIRKELPYLKFPFKVTAMTGAVCGVGFDDGRVMGVGRRYFPALYEAEVNACSVSMRVQTIIHTVSEGRIILKLR